MATNYVFLTNQNDTFGGTALDDSIYGYGGNDNLSGGDGNDIVNGGSGNDYLRGGNGDDVLISASGNNHFYGDEGSDQMFGGTGTDSVHYLSSTRGVHVNLDSGIGYGDASGDTFHSIENAYGSNFGDGLVGTSGVNVLNGWGGDDTLVGLAGGDKLYGGTGLDIASYADSDARVNINLKYGQISGGHAEGDVYNSIEGVWGSQFGDSLTGTDSNNRFFGDHGGDFIDGQGGNDEIDGQWGDDVLLGGAGNDVINGGTGNDTIFDGTGDDTVNGGSGDDTIWSGTGQDELDGGTGVDTIAFSTFDDIRMSLASGRGYTNDAAGDRYENFENVLSSLGDDTIYGDNGANKLETRQGDDFLSGYAGNDVLDGGAGNDTLDGGAGVDQLTGGTGNDVFRFSHQSHSTPGAYDTITDFGGSDKIDLSLLDANYMISGNQAFEWIDTANFTEIGQVREVRAGSSTYIQINLDNDTNAEMQIRLAGSHNLDEGDFFL